MTEIQSALSGISGIFRIFSLWVGLVVTIVGGIISLTNYFYSKKKDKFNALVKVFNHLNNDRHTEARRYYSP